MYHVPQSAIDRARQINEERWARCKAEFAAKVDAHLALARAQSELRGIRVGLRYDLIDFMNRLAVE